MGSLWRHRCDEGEVTPAILSVKEAVAPIRHFLVWTQLCPETEVHRRGVMVQVKPYEAFVKSQLGAGTTFRPLARCFDGQEQ
jgi:hypothetical protein